tara:strand:- start:379 stop:1656 length:1278 start_codon:yes stop_codon:yes gene_type:complete
MNSNKSTGQSVKTLSKLTDRPPKNSNVEELEPPKKQWVITSIEERFEEGKKAGPKKMLLGSLMTNKSLTFLYGRFGVGKSALAFQIAFAAATGENLFKLLENESEPMNVLYFDGELDDGDIYSRLNKEKKFPKNIQFINVNYDYKANPDEVLLSILDMIEKVIKSEKEKYGLVIIDNLHMIGERLEESTAAKRVVMQLKRIKSLGVAVLVVAHAIKIEDYGPVTSNKMQGSAALSAIIDSLIGIGKSQRYEDDSMKYLVNLKNRHFPEEYNKNKTISTQLVFDEERGLIHKWIDTCPEADHWTNVEPEEDWKQTVREFYEDQLLLPKKHKLKLGSHNSIADHCIGVLKVDRGKTTVKTYLAELKELFDEAPEKLIIWFPTQYRVDQFEKKYKIKYSGNVVSQKKSVDRPNESQSKMYVIGGENGA